MKASRTTRRIDPALASRLRASLEAVRPVAVAMTCEPSAREIVEGFFDEIRALRCGAAAGQLGVRHSWASIAERLRAGGSIAGPDAIRKAFNTVEAESGLKRRKKAQAKKPPKKKMFEIETCHSALTPSATPSMPPIAQPPINRFRRDRDDLQNIDCKD